MPPGSSARTAALPRAICIDARFFELASVKNSVPCSNSNAASTSFGEIPAPSAPRPPAASAGVRRSSGAARESDRPRRTPSTMRLPMRSMRARRPVPKIDSSGGSTERSTNGLRQEHPIEPPADDVRAAAPRGRRRDREARARLQSYREDWPESCTRSDVDGRELNGHCRRQNLMRLIALLLTAMLIGPAAAAQTADTVLAAFAGVLGRGREGRRGSDFPVSLGKIRDALERASAAPGFLLKNVQDTPHVPHRDSRAPENRGAAGDAGFQGRTDAAGRRLRLRAAAGHVSPPSTIRWPSRTRRSTRRSWRSSRPSRPSARCSPNTWRRV